MRTPRLLPMAMLSLVVSLAAVFSASVSSAADDASRAPKIRVLIVDGQNNHDWKSTTPILKRIFEESGRFTVDVATSPAQGEDMSGFRPKFAEYDVVVSNYNGEPWPDATQRDFESFVAGGGGFVSVHAADNAFPKWPAYNRMIGLGGWGDRTEKDGPYVYIGKDGKLVRDSSVGSGGNHGTQHEFQVRTRDADHPIMRGLPEVWLHTKDELYERLRGPAEDMQVLATAFAAPEQRGSGRHEPLLMAIDYGNGRVFHTALGHADYSMNCVGFATTLLRGTEWAATGEVTIPVPEDFPTAEKSSSRR